MLQRGGGASLPGSPLSRFSITTAWESGSRATLSVRFEGLLAPPVARATRNLNRRYLELEAAGLRARSLTAGWHGS